MSMEKTYILYSQSREDMEPILIKATTDINEMFETCTECWLGFDYEEIFEEEFTVESLLKHDFIDFGYDDDCVKCVFEKRETDIRPISIE